MVGAVDQNERSSFCNCFAAIEIGVFNNPFFSIDYLREHRVCVCMGVRCGYIVLYISNCPSIV